VKYAEKLLAAGAAVGEEFMLADRKGELLCGLLLICEQLKPHAQVITTGLEERFRYALYRLLHVVLTHHLNTLLFLSFLVRI